MRTKAKWSLGPGIKVQSIVSQVADSFQLIQNLRLAIEEQMSLSGGATGRALLPDDDIEIDHDRALHEQALGTRWPNQIRRTHRQSRKEVFETVHALSKEGLTCSEIARRTGYGRGSIAKWLTFETRPTDAMERCSRHLLFISRPFSRLFGRTATAVVGICFMTSSTAGIPAAFPISNASWQPDASPRGRKRIRKG
jgi:hypothetical protein